METKKRKCRIWWPTHLSSTHHQPQHSAVFLFGWFVSSSSETSLDVVVSFASDEPSLSSVNNIKGILHETNGNMPVFLQDKCTFCMLGYCTTDLSSSSGQLLKVGRTEDNHINSTHVNICPQSNGNALSEWHGQWSCGCPKLDGSLEQHRLASVENNRWVLLVKGSFEYIGKNIHWIPKFHHIHWNSQMIFHFDLHVILYETPTFGGHHFSLGFWSSSEQVKSPLKKPKWVEDLHQKQPLLGLDTVILAINCATAARLLFERHVLPEKFMVRFRFVCMFFTFTWKLLAVSVASFFTLFYIILQFLHFFLSCGSQSSINIALAKVFSNSWKNIQIRCCQILYWPIFLRDNSLRSRCCVEYAEKDALQKHSMWSSIAVDVILGNMLGIALLFHAEYACRWVLNFSNDITNSLLRTSCVWLMGNPAGFKLNTELAGVLGMMSLNAIQFWSTLWFFVGFLFIYLVKGLAMSGVLFGLTIPASIIVDMISLATVHLSTLHLLISVLYSWQIQAIAALWRLFRGQKWNPLRQRLDSYEYTVEQHILGSLLFTPLLLLLPTTSAFYIFFTIMNTTITFICILVEVTISFIHATPYTKIFLWLVKPIRFPSGIWFEILYCQSNVTESLESRCDDEIGSLFEKSHERVDMRRSKSTELVSFLHSNYLNIGQIVWPHWRGVFSAFSRSSIASSAYGVLTGMSMSSAMEPGLPSKMPWMFIPCKEYWRLCHDAVLACQADCDCHVRQ